MFQMTVKSVGGETIGAGESLADESPADAFLRLFGGMLGVEGPGRVDARRRPRPLRGGRPLRARLRPCARGLEHLLRRDIALRSRSPRRARVDTRRLKSLTRTPPGSSTGTQPARSSTSMPDAAGVSPRIVRRLMRHVSRELSGRDTRSRIIGEEKAISRTRTEDLLITNELLYQLS